MVGYLWWRLPEDHGLAALGYSLILAGALGNLMDRVRLGEVVDFLDFLLGPLSLAGLQRGGQPGVRGRRRSWRG